LHSEAKKQTTKGNEYETPKAPVIGVANTISTTESTNIEVKMTAMSQTPRVTDVKQQQRVTLRSAGAPDTD
jgi:hypothetical protein